MKAYVLTAEGWDYSPMFDSFDAAESYRQKEISAYTWKGKCAYDFIITEVNVDPTFLWKVVCTDTRTGEETCDGELYEKYADAVDGKAHIERMLSLFNAEEIYIRPQVVQVV